MTSMSADVLHPHLITTTSGRGDEFCMSRVPTVVSLNRPGIDHIDQIEVAQGIPVQVARDPYGGYGLFQTGEGISQTEVLEPGTRVIMTQAGSEAYPPITLFETTV